MKLRSAPISAVLAMTLVATPLAANAAPAADRESSTAESEQLAGGLSSVWIVAAVLAIGVGIIVLTDDDDEAPVSP
jgi:hypothetical protein